MCTNAMCPNHGMVVQSFCAACQCPVIQQHMHHSCPATKMSLCMPLLTTKAPLCHLIPAAMKIKSSTAKAPNLQPV